MKKLFSLFKKANLSSGQDSNPSTIPPRSKSSKIRHSGINIDGSSLFFDDSSVNSWKFRVQFYRFLRNNIPTINSAIWTWSKMCNAPRNRFYDSEISNSTESEINEIASDLERRIFPFGFWRYGGFDALLDTLLNALFTDGATCGELVLNPAGDGILGFYPIDTSSLLFKHTGGNWDIYQSNGEHNTKLPPQTLFYYGLDAEASDPRGRSIIASVPFVARIEQELVSDMGKAVHNAGYHRLQVSIAPPEKLPGESDNAFIERANNYFDDTASMMNNLETDDNPITWNDVEIKHVGPSNYSSIGAWYLNHRAVIEDICCGCHLDPFMLGYSYGSTQSWAKFKYEIVLRQVYSIQSAAAHLLDWLVDIELALKKIPIRVYHRFDNSKAFGMVDQRKAEQTHISNVITLLNSGLISEEQAKSSLEV
ncbi:MAG: hypothetical protein GY855_11295 [candidate division Zixibacteria bacterium]|nr:hypothetical protein [candidate division Zixibacteria bacterium]